MLLALIGLAEIAAFVRLKGLFKELSREAIVVAAQIRRVGAVVAILEERMGMLERTADAIEKGDCGDPSPGLVDPAAF